jgi:hypothetical protein
VFWRSCVQEKQAQSRELLATAAKELGWADSSDDDEGGASAGTTVQVADLFSKNQFGVRAKEPVKVKRWLACARVAAR